MDGCYCGELAFNDRIENVRRIPGVDTRVTGTRAFGIHRLRTRALCGRKAYANYSRGQRPQGVASNPWARTANTLIRSGGIAWSAYGRKIS